MPEPLVTVLMPVYNGAAYIREAIRSVLEQDYPDFELLIVNDGSTDETLSIISSFKDPRIRVIGQTNQGISPALNNGLEQAKGKYIARFDADDICMPQRLSLQVAFLEAHPGYFICGSDAAYITAEGEALFDFSCAGHEHEQIRALLYTHCPLIHSAAMYRKNIVLEGGGYPLHAHSFEDHLLWVQLRDAGLFYNIPQPLIKVRFSPSSFTMDEKWRGRGFRRLKQKILQQGFATAKEGAQLLEMIRQQNDRQRKLAAYYSLCAKKYLVNNYRPVAARAYAGQAIRKKPFRIDSYLLWFLSFCPESLIAILHPSKKTNRDVKG